MSYCLITFFFSFMRSVIASLVPVPFLVRCIECCPFFATFVAGLTKAKARVFLHYSFAVVLHENKESILICYHLHDMSLLVLFVHVHVRRLGRGIECCPFFAKFLLTPTTPKGIGRHNTFWLCFLSSSCMCLNGVLPAASSAAHSLLAFFEISRESMPLFSSLIRFRLCIS
jgi:hypothetical protein